MAKKKAQWIVCNDSIAMPIGETEYEIRLDKIEPLESGSRACFALLNGEVQDIVEVNIADSEKRGGLVSQLSEKYRLNDSDVNRVLLELYEMAKAVITEEQGPENKEEMDERNRTPYIETENGIIQIRSKGADYVERIALTNFTARIVTDTQLDDGVESRREFTLQVKMPGMERHINVLASKFATMNWAAEQVGSEAVVYAGMGKKDHARAAIQMLSLGQIEKRIVFTHLGWRKNNGVWFYLHNGGAIGENGLSDDVTVQVPSQLSHYDLPQPPTNGLEELILTCLQFLNVAPLEVTVPLFAVVWRAPLMEGDMGMHVVGHTGQGKTALASLAQQFYGSDMTARLLPGNWSATENVLEELTFVAKDALIVIDEFVPSGLNSMKILQRKAERVFRAQANRSARQRMRSDGTLREGRPPRGFVLSTGEDMPDGESLTARIFTIELPRGGTDFDKLTMCQASAGRGDYAALMSAFLQWIAPHYDCVQKTFQHERNSLRALSTDGTGHRRVFENAASLAMGWMWFLRFTLGVGLMSTDQCATVFTQVWDTLCKAAQAQALVVSELEPATRFLTLLQQALSSGRAYIAAYPNGGVPGGDPGSLGWQTNDQEQTEQNWRPKSSSEKVGWVEGNHLYLLPGPSYASVAKLAEDAKSPLNITSRTLNKRLYEAGYLMETDRPRQTLTVRRKAEGITQQVLFLSLEALSPEKPDIPDIKGENKQANVGLDSHDVGFYDFMTGLFPVPDTDNSLKKHGLSAECRECRVFRYIESLYESDKETSPKKNTSGCRFEKLDPTFSAPKPDIPDKKTDIGVSVVDRGSI